MQGMPDLFEIQQMQPLLCVVHSPLSRAAANCLMLVSDILHVCMRDLVERCALHDNK